MKNFILPSDNQPFELDPNCSFYSNHYVIDGYIVPYEDVAIITWINSSKSMNAYTISSESEYYVFATTLNYVPDVSKDNVDELFSKFDDFSYKKGIINNARNFLKRQKFIHNFLYTKTKDIRLDKSLQSLKQFGSITLPGNVKFLDDGDVFINSDYQGNLYEKFKENKIINGVKYGGYSNSVNNPYEFGFVKNKKFFGIIENKFEYQNVHNTDVMDLLFANLFRTNSMSKSIF